MSNNYLPHLLVLPEDEHNREFVLGFIEHHRINSRAVDLRPVAKGWQEAFKGFEENIAPTMQRFKERRVLIVIDFDLNFPDRLQHAKATYIDQSIQDRVFVIGCSDEPKDLLAELANVGHKTSRKQVGADLAAECVGAPPNGPGGGPVSWSHAMLAHNRPELDRLRTSVGKLLFQP